MDYKALYEQHKEANKNKSTDAKSAIPLALVLAVLAGLFLVTRFIMIPAGHYLISRFIPSQQSNPFAPRLQSPTNQSPQGTESNATHQAEASVILANVLSAASLPGFRVGSGDEAKIQADAFWTAGGIFGSLNIIQNVRIDDPEIKAGVIGSDAKSCKGKFVSGSLPETEGNDEVRMFTSCEASDKNTFTVYYIAVPRQKGGIYLFATAETVSPSAGDAQEKLRTVDAGLRTAVFQVVK